jgi:bacterioferritin-associated ferredoxin
MYICICKQVTDKQIKQAIQNGANNIKAIQNQLGASSECGSCLTCIHDMLEEYVIPISNIQIINTAVLNAAQ